MCFTQKFRNSKKGHIYGLTKNKRLKKIYPEPKPFFATDENILCYGCQTEFTLESNQIQIHCVGCHRFFHCKLAGTCYGNNCYTGTVHGQKHYLSWCINCVPGIPENKIVKRRSDKCICHKCMS